MANANQELPSFNEERWNEQSQIFKESIASLGNETLNNAINVQLDILRDAWRAENRGTSRPDFQQFQENCHRAITEHLPAFQRPSMQELLIGFLKGLFVVTLGILCTGLMMMLQAQIGMLIGIMTIAAFHFKALAVISVVAGAVIAGLASLSLFKPSLRADASLGTFVRDVMKTSEIGAPQVSR